MKSLPQQHPTVIIQYIQYANKGFGRNTRASQYILPILQTLSSPNFSHKLSSTEKSPRSAVLSRHSS